jgi:DNA mismatch repair protein MSH2
MKPDESTELKYASLNKNLFERLAKELLLVHFYRVEIYSNKKGSKDEYYREYHGSPGNLWQFENLIFNSSESEIFSNFLVAIQLTSANQLNKIGLAVINRDEMEIKVSEFEDSDFFSELEAAIVILSPKEVLLPSQTSEYAKVKEILDRNGILTSLVKKSDFIKNSEFLQDLEKIYRFKKGQQKNIYTIPEIKLEHAMGSLAAALKYLEIVKDESCIGKFNIKLLNLNRFVHMDTAAFTALNLFPPPGVNYRSSVYKWHSVLGVLDKCKTNQGRRLLRQWLKQPLRDIEKIRDRHDVLESLVENQEARMSLHIDHLSVIPDILMLTNKVSRKRATLQDVFKIYQVILRLPNLLKIMSELNCDALTVMAATPLKDLLGELKKIEDMVEEVLDLESLEKGEYLVRPSFDEKLKDIKENLNDVEGKIKKEFKKAAKLLQLDEGKEIKLDYASHLGYFFRTTKKEDQTIRKHKIFKIIDTARGGLRFTVDNLKDYNEEYSTFKENYEETQKDIVNEICRIVAGYSAPLTSLNHIIALLDVFVSLAQVITNSPGQYVRPQIFPETERILEVKELRHPCLECQEDLQFIPNDVTMKSDESEFFIITGANTGGKSTYIRSIGLAVYLSQIGMFVPCEEAKISLCDNILARIGGKKGLSFKNFDQLIIVAFSC